MKKITSILAGLLVCGSAFANEGIKRETVGVDGHYAAQEGGARTWAGSLSYGRLVMSNFEVAGAYTFEGTRGVSRTQGLQLIGRQWFGTFGRTD